MSKSVLVTALLLLAGCAQDKLIVSGESIAQLGEQFVATADTMNAAYTNGVITNDQYKAWVTFGKKFQLVYPQAVKMWKIARETGDLSLEAQMVATVTALAMGLATYSGMEVK